jgi:hypothetical protein
MFLVAITKWGHGKWFSLHRMEARKIFAYPRRAEKLKVIGLTWDVLDEQWEGTLQD